MKRLFLPFALLLTSVATFLGGGFAGRHGAWIGEALAQSPPRVSTRVIPTEPEAGQTFQLILTVLDENGVGRVSSPTLRTPSGLRASPARTGTQTSMRIVNGVTTRESGATVTWTILAEKEGRFTIPAPSVEIDGRVVTGQPQTVQVQAPGSGGAASPFPTSPFSSPFFSMPPPPAFGFDDRIDDDTASGNELSMRSAPDPDIFLRAVPDKTEVVVGEQVTLSFYVYYRVDFEMTERQEAPLSNFLRFPILTDPGSTRSEHTSVGDQRWDARLIDRIAIFPIKEGKLSTGSFGARFKGRRIGARVLRSSNDVTIDVREPPAAGRPAGYVVGDVGNYQLTATVVPRAAAVGDAITVMVRVEGVGNVPSSIRPPVSDSVEWLEPEKKENISARGGKVSGYRTFGYVAVVKKPGRIDLGKFQLPTYDPEAKAYKVAEVDLGRIDVTGTAKKEEDAESETKILAEFATQLPPPKKTLTAFTPQRPFSVDASLWMLALPPLVALGLVGAIRVRRRLADRAEDTGPKLRKTADALSEARRAEKSGDTKAAARAASDALHAAIAGRTGKNPKGMPSHEIEAALVEAGVDAATTSGTLGLLRKLDEVRFLPDGGGPAAGLSEEASALTKALKSQGA